MAIAMGLLAAIAGSRVAGATTYGPCAGTVPPANNPPSQIFTTSLGATGANAMGENNPGAPGDSGAPVLITAGPMTGGGASVYVGAASIGGAGGIGANAHPTASSNDYKGGLGGAGGSGGALGVAVSGAVSQYAVSPPNFGVCAYSQGGPGGGMGLPNSFSNGDAATYPSAMGGTAGPVSVSVVTGGSVASVYGGIAAEADGGAGGAGVPGSPEVGLASTGAAAASAQLGGPSPLPLPARLRTVRQAPEPPMASPRSAPAATAGSAAMGPANRTAMAGTAAMGGQVAQSA